MQSFSTSPALALAAAVGFIQTTSGTAAAIPLGGATRTPFRFVSHAPTVQHASEAAAADVVSEADQQPQQLLAQLLPVQLLPVQLLIAVAESKTTGEGTESPDATARTCSCTTARNVILRAVANAASPAKAAACPCW